MFVLLYQVFFSKQMWWAMWCAAVVVGSSVVVAAPAPDSLNMDMVQIDPSASDDVSVL